MSSDEEKNYWQENADQSEEAPVVESEEPSEQPEVNHADAAPSSDIHVNWAAHEYVDPERNSLWYIAVVIVALAFVALDIFVLKSYTFSAVVIVMAIALIVYSRRPPKEMQYTLSGDQGLFIGDHLYHFTDFKAFGVIKDGEHHSIMLIPTKRFALGVSVYFPEEAGERIVDILGTRLPMRPLKLDLVDNIVRRLRL